MAVISNRKVTAFFRQGDVAKIAKIKGDALENAICYIFEKVPGISITRRNRKDAFGTEEIDIAFWNERHAKGLPFLPHIILVECKNWGAPVGSLHVGWFDTKLRNRGQSFGILVASSGITGDSSDITDAHSMIAKAASEQRKIVVFTRDDLLALRNTEDLVRQIKLKMCDITITGTSG